MSTKALLLSSKGLANVVFNENNEENIFYFHFRDHEIKTNNFFAEFISPSVSHLHLADPTINSIDYSQLFNDFHDKNSENVSNLFSKEAFSLLEQLMRGNSIEINEDQSYSLHLISIILDNKELFDLI